MKIKFKKIITFVVIFSLGFLLCFIINEKKRTSNNDFFATNIDVMLNEFSTDKEIDEEKLKILALKELTKSLGDEYSYFMDREELNKYNEDLSGKYIGIGIRAPHKKEGEGLVLDRVFKGSSAYNEGLLEYDVIEEIDGQNIENYNNEDATQMLIGAEGTSVKLKVFRPSTEERLDFIIPRKKVKIDLIDYTMLNDNVGYISLLQFSDGVEKDFEKCLKQLMNDGAKKLIIDIRNNGGGEVNPAAIIGGMFLEPEIKEICKFVNKRNKKEVKISNLSDRLFDGDVIILVNNGSASASEMMSDSLRKHGKVKIVGMQTFGKGAMQGTFLDKKNGTALNLTIANYVSGEGKYIDGVGISPDIKVEQDELLSEMGYMSEKEERKKNRLANIKSVLLKKYGLTKAEELLENGDLQLKRALEELSK